MKIPTSILLSPEIYQKLDDLSRELRKSKSEIIEEALLQYFSSASKS